LSGTVLALLNDTTLRLQTPAGLLDIVTDMPLPTGTHVAITVQGTPQQPELIIAPVQGGSGQPSVQHSSGEPDGAPLGTNSAETNSTAASANSSAANIAESADQPSTAARAATPVTPAALSAAAVILRNAAATQGSLTTLYSNLEIAVATAAPSMPAPVLEAARQLLTMRLDITSGSGVDADDIKLALMRSGLVTNSPVTGALQTANSADLSAALIVLRQVLKN